MIIGGMAMDRILGHPGTAHAVEESRLVVGVGRVQLVGGAVDVEGAVAQARKCCGPDRVGPAPGMKLLFGDQAHLNVSSFTWMIWQKRAYLFIVLIKMRIVQIPSQCCLISMWEREPI